MSGLSHLDELEAEAIYIIREVAAECEKPVMLYSIGKDSSVMLHLALKAFYPDKPPYPIVPLYFAKERPVVYRDGNIIMVDDDRMRLKPGEKPEMKKVRFRTLGCYPLTGGILSDADTLDAIIDETLSSVESERTSRIIDSDGGAASMEKRKREGYF